MKTSGKDSKRKVNQVLEKVGVSYPAFMDGVRSALDPIGGGQMVSLDWLENDPAAQDTESLKDDWEAIGEDFRRAISLTLK